MTRRTLALLLASLALGLPCAVLAQEPARPSFDCAMAGTAVERAICADKSLAREDAVMARLYKLAAKGTLGRGQSGVGAAQLKWLAGRKDCLAGARSAAECLTRIYRIRNAELAVGALPHDRTPGLAELRRLDPAGAPLIAALTLYADHPAGSDWTSAALAADRSKITKLLEAPFNTLMTNSDQGYGKSILADDVTALGDAFKSDDAFALTFAMLANYAESALTPLVIPCTALLRNPALLAIESPRFGSTMDNFIPQSDCAETWKRLPALDALTARIWKTWPNCEGTIRYAGYRSFSQNEDAARLGIPKVRTAKAGGLPRVKGVMPALVNAALTELSAQYVTERDYSPAEAKATARARMDALLTGAHECGG